LARRIQWNAFEASGPIPEQSEFLRLFVSSARPLSPFEGSYDCAGLVGGSIRERLTGHAEGEPACRRADEHLRRHCDRDDLNVCKRAPEIGDGTSWKLEAR